jgi:VanZ family protein
MPIQQCDAESTRRNVARRAQAGKVTGCAEAMKRPPLSSLFNKIVPARLLAVEPAGGGRWLRWAFPLIVALSVFIASSRSQVAAPPVVNVDKLAHFAVYGLFATLIVRAPGIRRWWWAIVIVSLFGMTDEFHQSFTPGRAVEFNDWLADTLGGTVAVVAYTFWPWYRRLLESNLRLWPKAKREPSAAPSAASINAAAPASSPSPSATTV